MTKRETIKKINDLLRRGDRTQIALSVNTSLKTVWMFLSGYDDKVSDEIGRRIIDEATKIIEQRQKMDKEIIKKVNKW